MDVLHSRIGAIHLIQLRGRLDATQVDGLSERLMPMLDDPEHRMVVSLAELTGITSIGQLAWMGISVTRIHSSTGKGVFSEPEWTGRLSQSQDWGSCDHCTEG